MKKTLFSACFIVFGFFCSAQNTDSLTGPRVWLSADRSLLTPIKWTDRSFFKNDAIGVSAATTPSSYHFLNFNKSLYFDGVDDYLQIPVNIEGTAELTVLTVFQSADTTERGVWGSEQTLSRTVLLTTRRAIGPDTIADAYGKFEKSPVLNSVLQNWDKSTINVSASFVALGSAGKTRDYKPFQGSIAELLVFNRAISFLERVQYETYLAIKYGTGLGSGNFVSSQEKVLWNVEQNKSYSNNVAGIGRDDFFLLNQKQSGSAYDSGLLVMSAGHLANTNEENKNIINDQDFILWGDDGAELTSKPGAGADSLLSFMERKWLITANGQSANTLATEVQVDITKFPPSTEGYWMVIDRSATGNFSIDHIEYVFPSKVEDGKMIFENLKWDTDGSGKDNFGFVKARSLFALLKPMSNPSCTDPEAGKIKIDIIAGAAPFTYSLSEKSGAFSKDWKGSALTVEQATLVEGDYTLTVRDASGETMIRKFLLTTPDALHIDLGPDKKFNQSNPIVLDISSQIPDTVAVSYRWENSFGFSSTDEKVNVTETGIYRLTVTKESDGCVFTDELAITGAEKQRIAVFPNIINNQDQYNISVSLEEQGPVVIKTFSSTGVLLEAFEASGNSEYNIVRKMKESGLFVVVIQTAKGIESRKLIVH